MSQTEQANGRTVCVCEKKCFHETYIILLFQKLIDANMNSNMYFQSIGTFK